MPHRTLADLEQTLLDPVSDQFSTPPADAIARCQELAAAYHTHKRQQAPEDRPLRAYLLLDKWDDSAVATEFTQVWPEAAEARAAVPEAFYAGREGEAPCVVPLPEIALPDGGTSTLAQARAQEILAEWLQAASRQAYKRLAPQDLCAVLFSTDSADRVAQHLAKLGFQYSPGSTSARVFRYQDPRVMQRVWPELGAAQQSIWMGGIQAWWALTQPWGPWTQEDLMANVEHPVPTPAWFHAQRPAAPDGRTELLLHRLMNTDQWHAAHSAPIGNRVWARFARRGLPFQAQPDARTMTRLLKKGHALRLSETDQQDFVWCSWRPSSQNPLHGVIGQSIDWDDPHWRNVLARIQQGLGDGPEAGFASLFEEHKHFA